MTRKQVAKGLRVIEKPTRETVMADKSIAWWHDYPIQNPEGKIAEAASDLKRGGYVSFNHTDIPEVIWQQHLKALAEPPKTGLRLQQAPEVSGIYKDGDAVGVLLGYKAA